MEACAKTPSVVLQFHLLFAFIQESRFFHSKVQVSRHGIFKQRRATFLNPLHLPLTVGRPYATGLLVTSIFFPRKSCGGRECLDISSAARW